MRINKVLFLSLIVFVSAIAVLLATQIGYVQSGGVPNQVTNSTAASSVVTTSTSNHTAGFTDFIVVYVKNVLKPYIGEPPHIPASTLFTVGVAIFLGLMSSTAAKLLVDYDMVRNSMREFQAWRKQMDAAKKANDNQSVGKLMKKQQAMMKLQSRASMEQFKVTAVTFVPFLLLWYLLNAVVGGVPVAVAPFPLPLIGGDGMHMVFWQWYFLASFAVNFPMMRLFGIGMGEN